MKEVKVERLPRCDFCKKKEAQYDAKSNLAGIWGNMCENCFFVFGVGLGTGLGQKFIKGEG